MNKSTVYKKLLPDGLAILTFVIIAFVYFFTPTIQNKVLIEHDTAAGIGAGQEAKLYYEEHGERTRWTNSLFSGMPTYQISPSYNSTKPLKVFEQAYSLNLPQYMGLCFIMLVGFYILLRSFKVNPLISVLGAIMWAFSSYYFILIGAGHLWKYITLAYIPPTIAGVNWIYQKKYVLGGVVTALFGALQILSNHIQMSYYFSFVILFFIIAFGIQAKRNGGLKQFYIASGVLAMAGIFAILINSSTLYHTYKYSKESTRGKTELVSKNTQENTISEKEYITQWSYGIDETLTLLVPNFKGGVSSRISDNREAIQAAQLRHPEAMQYFTQYFGTQPFTAGPVYVGAFVLFLFFIGCFIVKGPIKWALVTATLFSFVLSWGKNLMFVTDFFIDYIPLYDKFRAVSSILVIAEFTIPLLAILGLVTLLNQVLIKEKLTNDEIKFISASFILTGGLALVIAIFPSISGPMISMQDANVLNQIPQDMAPSVMQDLLNIREYFVSKDAIRSLIIILAGIITLLLFFKKKINKTITISLVIIICLVDLWQVDKRYLNDSLFVPKKTEVIKKTEADKYILLDKDPNYRVLNLASNTFNENNTSYFHKSIGGYNAAKLRRYQELIEHGIYNDMNNLINSLKKNEGGLANTPILNMLNTKYIILGQEANSVLPNTDAYGNAWFVHKVHLANSANEEMDKLLLIKNKKQAVVRNTDKVSSIKNSYSNEGYIKLISYAPNKLVYKSKSDKEGFAVFSEIYYPDWTATLDGKQIEIQQANYVLRGLAIPEGEHEVTFEFNPKSIKTTEIIALLFLFILGAVAFIALYKQIVPKKV